MNNSEFFKQANLINGNWIQSDAGDSFQVTNPASVDVIGDVPKSGAAETCRAIEAAETAFAGFRLTTANQRAAWLRKMHDVMLENQDDLAKILTLEQGKPQQQPRPGAC